MQEKRIIHVCVTWSPCCTVEKKCIGEITTEYNEKIGSTEGQPQG